MRFCPQCGQPAQDEHRFCMHCGQDVTVVPAVGPPGFSAPLFPPPPVKGKSSAKVTWIVTGAIVAIVGIPVLVIIAAIVLPAVVNEHMTANEMSALNSLRQLNGALITYRATYQHGYPTDLALLGPRASGEPNELGAALVESAHTLPVQSGYRFSYDARAPDAAGHPIGFVLYVDPVSPMDGHRHFYLDQSGVIRVARGVAAAETSPALDEDRNPTLLRK